MRRTTGTFDCSCCHNKHSSSVHVPKTINQGSPGICPCPNTQHQWLASAHARRAHCALPACYSLSHTCTAWYSTSPPAPPPGPFLPLPLLQGTRSLLCRCVAVGACILAAVPHVHPVGVQHPAHELVQPSAVREVQVCNLQQQHEPPRTTGHQRSETHTRRGGTGDAVNQSTCTQEEPGALPASRTTPHPSPAPPVLWPACTAGASPAWAAPPCCCWRPSA